MDMGTMLTAAGNDRVNGRRRSDVDVVDVVEVVEVVSADDVGPSPVVASGVAQRGVPERIGCIDVRRIVR